METYKLTVVEPEAMDVIHHLAQKGSVKLQKLTENKKKTRLEKRAFYLAAPVMSDSEYRQFKENREWMSKWRTK